MGNIIIDRRRKRHDITSENKRERRKALKDMVATNMAINTMLNDTYLYQIPFGSIRDISTANIHQISKEWLKRVKPKKRMTKKEYRRWKNKTKRLGVE